MKTADIPKHSVSTVLDRLLDPLTRSLTPELARILVKIRLDEGDRRRIAELAEKCNEGALTRTERKEYEEYVRGGDFITILRSEARQYLRKHRKS